MLAQANGSTSLSLLVILSAALIVGLAVSFALVRLVRRRLVSPGERKDSASPATDAWEEAGRRMQTPPEDQ